MVGNLQHYDIKHYMPNWRDYSSLKIVNEISKIFSMKLPVALATILNLCGFFSTINQSPSALLLPK